MEIVFVVIILALMFVFIIIYDKQQKTIDRLTDRLMVQQGHREYIPRPKVEEPEPLREPMSFWDDPTIPLNNHRRSLRSELTDEIEDDYEPR